MRNKNQIKFNIYICIVFGCLLYNDVYYFLCFNRKENLKMAKGMKEWYEKIYKKALNG